MAATLKSFGTILPTVGIQGTTDAKGPKTMYLFRAR